MLENRSSIVPDLNLPSCNTGAILKLSDATLICNARGSIVNGVITLV
jgi:hypothetical protein